MLCFRTTKLNGNLHPNPPHFSVNGRCLLSVNRQGKVLAWYHNPCTEKNGGLDSEVPSERSSKKPRHSGKDFEFNTRHSSISQWASLPQEILILILDKVYERIDCIRLAAVCQHWENVSIEHNRTTERRRKVLPMLMIVSHQMKRMVCSISEGKIYTNVQLPVPYDRRCSGSSHGWLATVAENFAITLLNPFRMAVAIHLPPLTFSPPCPQGLEKRQIELKKKYEFYVHKVILSTDPSLNPDNYMVVAIYDLCYLLAFIKAGQREWTYISETRMFTDAIFHRGQIYAVGRWGTIMSFDVNSSYDISQPPKANRLTPLIPMYHRQFSPKADKAYLVPSSNGDLFHLRRFFTGHVGLDQKEGIDSFVVYKVFFNDNDGSIVKQEVVESIGDDALFLGSNHSFSISASKFPGCQPNSIYFTNDLRKGGIGIFKLEDESVTGLSPLLNPTPRTIWIVPPFKDIR